MDREAFKLRMKSLKSYRELNPGKGYWDWKVKISQYKGIDIDNDDTYDYEGFYNKYTDQANAMLNEDPNAHFTDEFKTPKHPTFSNESIYSNSTTPGGKWDYINNRDVYQFSDYTFKHSDETLDYLNRYDPGVIATYGGGAVLPEVKITGKKVKALAGGGVVDDYDPDKELKRSLNLAEYILKYKKLPTDDSQVIDRYVDKVIWPMENPENVGMRDDGLYYVYTDKGGDGVTRKNIGPGIESHSNMGKKLKYDNSQGYTKDELNNIVSKDLQKGTARIVNSLNTMLNGRYYGVWDTLSPGPKMTLYDIYHNVKAGNRKNLPEKWPNLINALSKGDLEEAKKQTYSGSTRRLKLRNGLLKYAEGGETDGLDEEAIKLMNLRLGRSASGRPLELGLKPVVTAEDIANMTPLGDVMSVAETADAVANKDWIGAGLAAIGVLPFVPTTVKKFRSKYKGITPKRDIPTVNKKALEDAINEALKYKELRINFYNAAINDRNNAYESLIENEDAFRRAVNFDRKYGTKYADAYSSELKEYARDKNSPNLILVGIKPMLADGSFDPSIPDYIFLNSDLVRNGKPRVGLVNHELGHAFDAKAGVIDEQGNIAIPIFKKDRFISDDKINTMYPNTGKRIKEYLENDSENKDNMNDIRKSLEKSGLLNPNGKETLNSFKKKLFNSNNENAKKLFNIYKSGKLFIKDFNSIPLISATALGANAYFTNNNNNNN